MSARRRRGTSPPTAVDLLLVLIMLVANNREVMGERVNGRPLNLLGWATALVMSVAAVALLASWVHP